LTFRFRKDIQQYLKNTLLDGEMVMDKVGGENVPRYLIYDVITFLGHPMRKEKFFPKRYETIRLDIVEPRYVTLTHFLSYSNSKIPMCNVAQCFSTIGSYGVSPTSMEIFKN